MKRYTTDAKGFGIIIGLIALVLFFAIFLPPRTSVGNSLPAFGLLFIMFITFAKGYFLTLNENIFMNVKVLFRKRIEVGNMLHITVQPAYRFIGSFIKSLYIFYRDESGDTKYTDIRIGTYKESTLASLINDLTKLNPNIKLDAATQKLMEKAGKT